MRGLRKFIPLNSNTFNRDGFQRVQGNENPSKAAG